METKQFLTIEQVCDMFNISRPTERKFRKQGILKPTYNEGRFVRYTEKDFVSEVERK